MTLARSRRDDFTSSSCSWRNVWRSCRASYSWSASGLIGPISRSSRSSSRARAAGVAPSASSGGSAAIAASGSSVEVAPQRLDRGLEAQLDLGLVELGAARLLARLLETALGVLALAAQLVEPHRGGPLGLALATTPLAQLAQLASRRWPGGRRRGRRGGRRRPAWRRARRDAPRPRAGPPPTHRAGPPPPTRRASGTGGARSGPAERTSRSARRDPTAAARSSRCALASAMAWARSAVSASSASRIGSVSVELGDPRLLTGQPLAQLLRRATASASASVVASRRSASTRWRPSVAAVSRPSCSSSWRDKAASAWRASSSSERAPCRLDSACDAAAVATVASPPRLLERRTGGARWTRCRPASRWRRSGRPPG